MTPAQRRADRGPLRWDQDDPAKAAKVSVVTLRSYELERSTPQRATLEVMRRALEAVGITIIPADGEDVGVRLRRSPGTPPAEPNG